MFTVCGFEFDDFTVFVSHVAADSETEAIDKVLAARDSDANVVAVFNGKLEPATPLLNCVFRDLKSVAVR